MNSLKTTSTLIFYVNGRKVSIHFSQCPSTEVELKDLVEDDDVDPEWTLLYYIRNKLQLKGTKLGCGEGGCGACTVMLSKYDHQFAKIEHLAINSCLMPICAVHGCAVTTVEGIGNTTGKIHAVQERIARAHGTQCGFCTPGFVMSMYALLRSLPRKPTMEELRTAFQGNLCRCTGYRPILDGFRTFLDDVEWNTCPMGSKCCKVKQKGGESSNYQLLNIDQIQSNDSNSLFTSSQFIPYDPTQEPIFPPELQLNQDYSKEHLILQGSRVTWHRPVDMKSLLQLMKNTEKYRLVLGNTEVGIEMKFNMATVTPVLIHIGGIDDFSAIKMTNNGVTIGACVTLTRLEDQLKEIINNLPASQTRIFAAITEIVNWFGGKQIRNVAGVAGNIMTSSPISDLIPTFTAAGCTLHVVDVGGDSRNVVMNREFFTGYRKNVISGNELLVSINIPFTTKGVYFKSYKQSRRREDDIAIVNASFNLHLNEESLKIINVDLVFGGMAATVVVAQNTKNILSGRKWNLETLEAAYESLIQDVPLSNDAPGGLIKYRRTLTLSFFLKFYIFVCKRLNCNLSSMTKHLSACENYENFPVETSQYFQKVPKSQSNLDAIGRPIPHQSAFKHATGEAIYCNDVKKIDGELYLATVLSSKAHAHILNVDATEALKLPGMRIFLSELDLPGELNSFNDTETYFARGKVEFHGQIIGVVVGENEEICKRAATFVKVEYEELKPIISMEEAIEQNSYHWEPPIMKHEDIEESFETADYVIDGEVRIGSQEHFYLETQSAFAIPGEEHEMEIISSSQDITGIQQCAAKALQIQDSKIVVGVKRLGGGFGGKEMKSIYFAVYCALAAQRTRKPVRCMLERNVDMITTGQRHPFLARYKVGFMKTCSISACQMDLYCNAGYSVDMSNMVILRSMNQFLNGYYVPKVHLTAHVCKTNLPSNTAFRGFGGPQAAFITQTIVNHVAVCLKRDVNEVAELNLQKKGQLSHINELTLDDTLRRCWTECVNDSNYHEKRAQVELFNKENRWKKRGIATMPTCHPISYDYYPFMHGNALIHIYKDASVLISIDGVEMGQGLFTKMIQVASRELGIPSSLIHISETNTDKIPNTKPTNASISSDFNGMAVKDACDKLNERLEPIRKLNPGINWEKLIEIALNERVHLSAIGRYIAPQLGFNEQKGTRNWSYYCTNGVAVSLVEIDCLTGDHQVISTHIVMDVGESLNPAIDIGQIEGAFIQGYGLFTLEELTFSPKGAMQTFGPSNYKIPGFSDIPAKFTVSLLRGSTTPRLLYSSKGIGEPPLCLSASIFFAIKDAIGYARKDFWDNLNNAMNNKSSDLDTRINEWFEFNAPATACRIRMACIDHITTKFESEEDDVWSATL